MAEGRTIQLSHELIIHPGETLAEIIEMRGMSQKELAARTGVTDKHINTVIKGKKNISASFAKKLEYALGVDAGFWMNLQTLYDKEMIDFMEQNNISEEELEKLKYFKEVIPYLQKKRLISTDDTDADIVIELRKFCNVSNIGDIPAVLDKMACRTQMRTNSVINKYAFYVWQRICEELTDKAESKVSLDKEKLRAYFPEIKSFMFKDPKEIQKGLTAILEKCGVLFNIVRHFPGIPVKGFVKETKNGNIILCLTLKGKRADGFWFTLFHELAHILNDDYKTNQVDFDECNTAIERRADKIASDALIDSSDYIDFIKDYKFDRKSIIEFAKSQNVEPYIVVGRLQKDEYLPWSYNEITMVKYVWAE